MAKKKTSSLSKSKTPAKVVSKTIKSKTASPKKAKPLSVVDALRQVVAGTYAVMGQTHICHWNVRGPGFFALHAAFEVQYTELFTAVDEIAERVRALGALAPGGLSNLAELAGINEVKEDASADEMVKHLLNVNETLVGFMKVTRDAAGDAGDVQTEDLMIARIQVHQKTIWMLKSYLDA